MQRILLLKGENSTRCFDISTNELHEKTALHILKERWENGLSVEPIPPTMPTMTENRIRKLIDDPELKEFANGRWKKYRENKQRYEREKTSWEMMKTCVETNDGNAAISILNKRSHYEGESFEIYDVEEIE